MEQTPRDNEVGRHPITLPEHVLVRVWDLTVFVRDLGNEVAEANSSWVPQAEGHDVHQIKVFYPPC